VVLFLEFGCIPEKKWSVTVCSCTCCSLVFNTRKVHFYGVNLFYVKTVVMLFAQFSWSELGRHF